MLFFYTKQNIFGLSGPIAPVTRNCNSLNVDNDASILCPRRSEIIILLLLFVSKQNTPLISCAGLSMCGWTTNSKYPLHWDKFKSPENLFIRFSGTSTNKLRNPDHNNKYHYTHFFQRISSPYQCFTVISLWPRQSCPTTTSWRRKSRRRWSPVSPVRGDRKKPDLCTST